MDKINVKSNTKAAFIQFKREFESEMELPRNMSQDDLVQLVFVKYKVQVLDVLVNAETILTAENAHKEGKVLA